tara:strand:- start:644 stop:1000 length:357 start_codon:yes stop_codon:yes gene_type:complete
MKYLRYFPLLLVFFPFLAHAQSVQQFFLGLITFVNSTVIPFLIGITFVIFVYNVIRYFVIGGANQESQEKARMFATYSVMALVFIIAFWGIINMLSDTLGLGGVAQTPSDYVTRPTTP